MKLWAGSVFVRLMVLLELSPRGILIDPLGRPTLTPGRTIKASRDSLGVDAMPDGEDPVPVFPWTAGANMVSPGDTKLVLKRG